MIEAVSAIVPAGGAISGSYAEATGTTIRCLAPMGPERAPVLNHVVQALATAPQVKRIVVAAPEEARGLVDGVDEWRASGRTGPESIRNALEALRDESMVLICTSDLPFITDAAIGRFLSKASAEWDVTIGLVRSDRYDAAFPGSPPSTYVTLKETGPVTLACLFLLKTSVLERSGPLLDACFAARKSLLQTAALLGPAVILRLLTKSLSLADLTARGTSKTGLTFDVLTDMPPELAFDIDTIGDYEYADAHVGTSGRQ